MSQHEFFREKLLEWFATHHRPLPWKGERDPYKIWLSEIMLQQTRVEQGLPYFQKFVEKWPTVRHLAEAPELELMKAWQGLGYYARARNLHETARHVAVELGGEFPRTFEGLRKLKGVGDYTAAAIASFAFDLSHAVLDGNVYRVLARFFGIQTPIDASSAKKEFSTLANQALDPARSADFNQAIMDFGATACAPRQPACGECLLREKCFAHLYNMVSVLPAKSKRPAKRERFFVYMVFCVGEETFIWKRTGRDIWQGLHEFPMLEVSHFPVDKAEASDWVASRFFRGSGAQFRIETMSQPFRQALTHQSVSAVFCEIALEEAAAKDAALEGCIRVGRTQLKKMYAVPRVIDTYLRADTLHLGLF